MCLRRGVDIIHDFMSAEFMADLKESHAVMGMSPQDLEAMLQLICDCENIGASGITGDGGGETLPPHVLSGNMPLAGTKIAPVARAITKTSLKAPSGVMI